MEKYYHIDYLKHDFVKAPKPAVPVTTNKNTLNKKVQKIFTTQSVAKPTLSLFQFKVLLVVTLTTLVLLLLLGGACIALLLKPEKGSKIEELVPTILTLHRLPGTQCGGNEKETCGEYKRLFQQNL